MTQELNFTATTFPQNHRIYNLDEKSPLSKLYGHNYSAAKISGTDGFQWTEKSEWKISKVFAECIYLQDSASSTLSGYFAPHILSTLHGYFACQRQYLSEWSVDLVPWLTWCDTVIFPLSHIIYLSNTHNLIFASHFSHVLYLFENAFVSGFRF